MRHERLKTAELLRLCGDLRDGCIADHDMERLDATLAADPAARKLFVDFMRVVSLLEQRSRSAQVNEEAIFGEDSITDLIYDLLEMEANAEQPIVDISTMLRAREREVQRQLETPRQLTDELSSGDLPTVRYYVIPRSVVYGALAALIAMMIALLWRPDVNAPALTPPIAIEQPQEAIVVGTIVDQFEAQWDGALHRYVVGAAITNEPITLRSGLVKLLFKNGAEVVIEGPARLEPISADEVRLLSGRLVGRCDTASSKGFSIECGQMRIVDVGTEFGIALDSVNGVELVVFDGEVQVHSQRYPDDGYSVGAHRALSLRADGQIVQKLAYNEVAMVRTDEFDTRARLARSAKEDRWQARLFDLRRDPNRVLYMLSDVRTDEVPAPLNEGFVFASELRLPRSAPYGAPYIVRRDWHNTDDPVTSRFIRCREKEMLLLDLNGVLRDRFEQFGLLDDEEKLGAAGTTLYISWWMKADQMSNVGFAGLSLCNGVDETSTSVLTDEVFFGRPMDRDFWAWDRDRDKTVERIALDFDPSREGNQPRLADENVHLWVVRFDFGVDSTRMRVYFDPDLSRDEPQYAQADLVKTNIQFDRIRFVSGGGAGDWWLGDLRIDTAYPQRRD